MSVLRVTTRPSEREKELAASLVFDTHWIEEAYLAISDLNRSALLPGFEVDVSDTLGM